jgi:ATP-dependent protease ClpP protease subunit
LEEFEILGYEKKCSLWDSYVPLIKKGTNTTAFLTEQIGAPALYNELCYKLLTANEYETFDLYINNGGGYLDSAFAIVTVLDKTKATVTAHLSGTVASAATIIALKCHKIEVDKYLQFMIHNYSGTASGKGNEIRAQVEFSDAQLNKVFKEIYGGFLTEHEMELIIAGKDHWMGTEEVLERLEARKKKDEKTLKKIAKNSK